MDDASGRFRAMERDAAAYEDLLAEFSGFRLQRWLQVPVRRRRRLVREGPSGEVKIQTADVYESDDAAEVAELRELLAARATSGFCSAGGVRRYLWKAAPPRLC